jgi:hypothetical protein
MSDNNSVSRLICKLEVLPRDLMTASHLFVQIALMVIAVMCLAINGGAVLPLASTFASTNLVSATILMAVVAMANVYTSDILLWQCLSCKRRDYETLADAIAGPLWKVCDAILRLHANCHPNFPVKIDL